MYWRTGKEKPGNTSSPSRISGLSNVFGFIVSGAIDQHLAVAGVDEPAEASAAGHPQGHLILYRTQVVSTGADFYYESGSPLDYRFLLQIGLSVVVLLG